MASKTFNVFPAPRNTRQKKAANAGAQGVPRLSVCDGEGVRPAPPQDVGAAGERGGRAGERGGGDPTTPRRKQFESLKKRMSEIRSAIDVARGIVGSVVPEGEPVEVRMEKAAKLLDVVQAKFKGLDRMVRDTLDAAQTSAATPKKPLYTTTGGASNTQSTGNLGPGASQPQLSASAGAMSAALQSSGAFAPRQTPAAGKDDNIPGKIVASLYFVLEAMAHCTQAEKGMVLLYNGKTSDELHAVATVGPRKGAVAGAFRAPINTGVLGSVFMTGIGVNQVPSVETKDKPGTAGTLDAVARGLGMRVGTAPQASSPGAASTGGGGASTMPPLGGSGGSGAPGRGRNTTIRGGMLCFPIQNINTSDVVGVVQLLNKRQSAEPFGGEDEQLCYAGARLLSFILRRYPVDFTQQFNPASLHAVVPPDLPPVVRNIPPTLQRHSSRQLVYRTGLSGQYIRQKLATEGAPHAAGPVSTSASLVEVDGYIQNLEECWRRSVGLNIDYEREHEYKLGQIRRMREESKKDRSMIVDLQDSLSMRSAEFDGYRMQYEGLRQDLQLLQDVKQGRLPVEDIRSVSEVRGLDVATLSPGALGLGGTPVAQAEPMVPMPPPSRSMGRQRGSGGLALGA